MKPAHLGDILDLEAYVTESNNTSINVCVDIFKSSFNNKKEKIGSGDAIFVALDENKKPTSEWRNCCMN